MNQELLWDILAVTGAVTLALGLLFLWSWRRRRKKAFRIPKATILELYLDGSLPELRGGGMLAQLSGGASLTVLELIRALERAAKDKRVRALLVRIGQPKMGWARIQEVRDAIGRFRSSGKPTLAFADTFGEGPGGTPIYFLASACESIHLQPSGDLSITGLNADAPFVKGAMEKLGVKPQMDRRHEYKNAMNMFTEEGFTEAHREATTRLLESIFEQAVSGIAQSRDLSEEKVRGLIDEANYSSSEALELGLVDSLDYYDQVLADLKERFGKKARKLPLSSYVRRMGPSKGKKLALVYGVGNVVRGASSANGLTGSRNMGADTVCAALRSAARDKKVQAIIFRIDSRGGSAVASDSIWRAVKEVQDKGKLVVATMGDVAASGGYYAAMTADRVLAQPTTITGSIGVIFGKFVTKEFWKKLGVQWDSAKMGAQADIWSAQKEFTEEQWAQVHKMLDRVYLEFTSKAAEARGMELEELQAVAKGRVWTGADALEHGLVDGVGGLYEAIEAAKEVAEIPANKDVRIQVFPAPKGFFQRLTIKRRGEDPSPLSAELQGLQELVAPIKDTAERSGFLTPPGVLVAPPLPHSVLGPKA
jgi:protease-4